MSEIIEILKYTVPALVTGATAVLTIKYFFDHQEKVRQADRQEKAQGTITPIRLQAYERVVLFLERMNPGSLVMRVNQGDPDARLLQRLLVHNVREEYEHNLSLQVYLTPKAWELVKSAKEELILLINRSAADLEEGSPGVVLAQRVFEEYLKLEKQGLSLAIDYLKKEVSQFF